MKQFYLCVLNEMKNKMKFKKLTWTFLTFPIVIEGKAYQCWDYSIELSFETTALGI